MADQEISSFRENAEKWVGQAEKAQRRVYTDKLVRFKHYDESHYLELAAQYYRVAKRFLDAGIALKQCGRLEEKLKKEEVSASFYHEAATCFQKEDPQAAVECFLNSINLYCRTRRFAMAARLQVEVAKMMVKDSNRPLTITSYIKAANFYRASTCFDKASDRCLLQAAHELSLDERYVEAANLFEEVGRRSVLDDLLKFNSSELFLKVVLCLLCACSGTKSSAAVHRRVSLEGGLPPSPSPTLPPTIDSIKAKILTLGKVNPMFLASPAFVFAMDVAHAGRKGDLDIFAARVYAYDNICRLDSWFLRILNILAGTIKTTSAKMRELHAKKGKQRHRKLTQSRAGLGKGINSRHWQGDASGNVSRIESDPGTDFNSAPVPATTEHKEDRGAQSRFCSSDSGSSSDSTRHASSYSSFSDEASSLSDSSSDTVLR